MNPQIEINQLLNQVDLLTLSTFFITLSTSYGIQLADLKKLRSNTRVILSGVCLQSALAPLIGCVTLLSFDLPQDYQLGLIIISSIGPGALSNLFTNLTGGSKALSVALTSISGFFSIGVFTIVMYFMIPSINSGQAIVIDSQSIYKSFLIAVICPSVLGVIMRFMLDKAEKLSEVDISNIERVLKVFAYTLLFISISKSQKPDFSLVSDHPQLILACGILLLTTLSLSYFIAKRLKLEKEEVIAFNIEGAFQNSALAISISYTAFSSTAALVPMVYGAFQITIGFTLVFYHQYDKIKSSIRYTLSQVIRLLKYIGILSLLLLLYKSGIASRVNNSYSLTISITGIEEIKGVLRVAIYDNSQDWLKRPIIVKLIKPEVGNNKCKVYNLQPRDYAVAVLHDIDSSNSMTYNKLKLPKEEYGFSNNVKPLFRPASFDESSFHLSGNKSIEVEL